LCERVGVLTTPILGQGSQHLEFDSRVAAVLWGVSALVDRPANSSKQHFTSKDSFRVTLVVQSREDRRLSCFREDNPQLFDDSLQLCNVVSVQLALRHGIAVACEPHGQTQFQLADARGPAGCPERRDT
jgi:hypothetical protein